MTPASQTPTLLVVSDQDALRLRAMLREGGGAEDQIVHVTSAAEARKLAAEQAFELVIVDARIGGEDGLELVRQLRAAGVESAVLFLTEERGEELAVEVLRAGATDYLNKSSLDGDALRRSKRYALDVARQAAARRRAEEALRLREEQLHETQRLETVATLASGVAHEFNNLLNIVVGYADLLKRRLPAGDPLLRYVEHIQQAGDKAAGLTRQLLAYSRNQVLQPSVLDAGRLVDEIAPVVRSVMGRRVELVTKVDASVGRITADRSQIEHALMSLIVNAKDAMPDGGRLTLAAESREIGGERLQQADPGARSGRYVVLSVSDTGTGMSPEVQSRAFEPFFTTKGRANATGLGLSTVQGIVKQSGGHVSLASSPGGGATFEIYLPQVDGAGRPVALEAPKGSSGHETILLVDDEPVMREVLSEALRSEGYSVREAGDAAEALRVAEASPEPIELLLTDVMMPGMSGTELAARLQQTRPSLRIVYMSGATREALRERDHTIEAPFLWKPFSTDELTHVVRQALEAGRP